MANKSPTGRLIARAHAKRELIDDVGVAEVPVNRPALRLNVVPVQPAGQKELGGEGIGRDLLQVATTGRREPASLYDLAVDTPAVLKDDMAELVRRSEALDVKAATRGHHN